MSFILGRIEEEARYQREHAYTNYRSPFEHEPDDYEWDTEDYYDDDDAFEQEDMDENA